MSRASALAVVGLVLLGMPGCPFNAPALQAAGPATLVGFLSGLGNVHDVARINATTYVASDYFGIVALDPSSLAVQGSAAPPFRADRLAITGMRAVALGPVGSFSHLWVLELSAPARPVVQGELATSLSTTGLAAFQDVVFTPSGGHAVIAAGTTGVWVVDLSNPQMPIVVGTYDSPETAWGVALNATGSHAFVADGASRLRRRWGTDEGLRT